MLNREREVARPLRLAIVGGERFGQAGYKHWIGALRDNPAFRLVAGACCGRDKDVRMDLGIEAERWYADYQTMFFKESEREDGIEVVFIATLDDIHYEVCKAALEAGIHVIYENVIFLKAEEVLEIQALAEETGKIVGAVYGLFENRMLLHMRSMIRKGELGDIRMVELQYAHSTPADERAEENNEDPTIKEPGCALGDLSAYTYYISRSIMPHMKIKKLLCDRHRFINSCNPFEDNVYVLMHYESGAVGRLWISSANAGCTDGHRIRIIGSKASLEWRESNPNELRYEVQGEQIHTLIRAMPDIHDTDERRCALYYEKLFEVRAFAEAINAKNRGDEELLRTILYPEIRAGMEGVRWIESCTRSADNGSVWMEYP